MSLSTSAKGLSVSLLAASIIIFTILRKNRSREGPPLPPGPPADPVIGHLRLIPADGQDMFFYKLGQTYGDVVHLRVLGRSIIVLNSVEAAVELLDKRSTNYSDRPKFPIYEIMGLADILVFVGYGNDLRMYRKMLHQYFSKDKARSHHPIQAREARLLAQNVLLNPQRLRDLLVRFATAIIIEIAYGHQIVSDDDPYIKLGDDISLASANSGPPGGTPVDIFPFLRHFPSWFPGAYYAGYARDTREVVRKLYEYPLQRVSEQMAKGEAKPSFLAHQLEELQREGPKHPANLEQIMAVSSVLYIAGSETTSSTLSFFILAMLLYPEYQTKAQEEIDAIIGSERLPEFHDRQSLPFLECLLQETLRWKHSTPSGVPHRSMEDDVYKGMFIPKGSIIIPNTRGMTLDENVYQNPFAFEPTRFLPSPLGRGEPHPIGPFGFGRRACLGQYVATDSLWIAMATILSTTHISKEIGEDGKEIVPDATPVTTGITSHPKPFPCRFKARTDIAQVLLKQSVAMESED
ncbi:cytochrome P450 [Lyophyllum atratum]|nr:cytochrome P450 [Lyophyllum atratum]